MKHAPIGSRFLLVTGLIITAFMLLLAFRGPQLAPHGIHDQVKMDYVIDADGRGHMIAPPLPPNAANPFGTDKFGYDRLTQMLYGAKYTVIGAVAIAFCRVLFGAMAGMFIGYSRRRLRVPLNFNLLNGIPVFIVAYFAMLGISVNSSLSPLALITILGVILLLLGLPAVAASISGKTGELRERTYILAAHSLGSSRFRILIRHILPHLKESLMILLVNETIMVLAMFGQLGLFHIFAGGTFFNPHDEPPLWMSLTHEWAGMVANSRQFIYVDYWIVGFPLLGYLLLIAGLYLVSRGLESLYREKYSRYPYL